MTGQLVGIARHAEPRATMESIFTAKVKVGAGIEGDFRGGVPERNVTLLFREDWDAACRDLGYELPWTTRRANLFVEGLTGFKHVGAQLKVGDVLLEVTEENPPCRVMDIQAEGLRRTLELGWRGGVACRVLQDGEIRVGDKVAVVNR